jgi:DNA (cytosine-5)-methyltransferase 1
MAVGGDLAWVCDFDKGAAKILAHRYPDVPNLHDLTVIDWSEVEPVDVITAGYPCQPFSHAGNRKGTTDERHIWPHIADAIRVLRPRFAVFENVAGHVSLGLADVLADLAALGFDAEWTTVRASDVGAPHRRERLFIVATNTDEPGRERPEPAGRRLMPARRTTTDTAGDGREQGRAESAGLIGRPHAAVSGDATPDADNGGLDERSEEGRPGEVLRDMRGGTNPKAVREAAGGSRGIPPQAKVQPELRERQNRSDQERAPLASAEAQSGLLLNLPSDSGPTRSPHRPQHGQQREGELEDAVCFMPPETALAGGSRCAHESGIAWGAYTAAIRRWELVLRRCAPTPTEVSPRGRTVLSPAFCEWMMGIPEGWVTDVPGLSRVAQLKALGNGVAPAQAAAALTQLHARLPN